MENITDKIKRVLIYLPQSQRESVVDIETKCCMSAAIYVTEDTDIDKFANDLANLGKLESYETVTILPISQKES
jgi:hypothetical protein